MKKEVKIFFEDLLKKTHINGLAMVAVNTTSNSHEIWVIDESNELSREEIFPNEK